MTQKENDENYVLTITNEMLKDMGIKNLEDTIYVEVIVKNGFIELKYVESEN